MRAARTEAWIRSPLWDVVWVLSFLWLAPLILILARGFEDIYASPADSVYFALTIAFWIGHRFSSTWLAYFTTAYRPLLRTQRTRFVWVPLGILVFVAAVLLPPDEALPFTRLERLMALTILDVLFVTYHFAAQHYGFLSLYRVRAGQVRSTAARRVDRIYALVVGGAVVLVAQAVAGILAYQPEWIDSWLDPVWVEAHLAAFRAVLGGIILLGVIVLLAFEVSGGSPSLPRVLYVLGIAAMATAALFLNPFLFLMVWTAQHWIAATGLASLAARAEPEPGASRWYRLWHPVNQRAWALVLVLVCASILLTPAMEVEALPEGVDRYGDRVFPFAADWWGQPGVVPFLLVLGLVTAFVHYALDRAVWRLSDPEVRQAAAGILQPPR